MIVSKSLLKRLLSEPLRAVDRATLHAVPLGKCSLCYITFVGYCGYKPLCRLGSRNVVKCVLEFLDRDFVETTPDVFRKFWADSSNDGYRSTSTAWARSQTVPVRLYVYVVVSHRSHRPSIIEPLLYINIGVIELVPCYLLIWFVQDYIIDFG